MATDAIEDCYRRITALPRVVGFMVITLEGVSIKSTLSPSQTLKYTGQVAPLIDKARKMIRELVVEEEENQSDEVVFIRMRTNTHEVLIAPDKDYAMIVLQHPHEQAEEEEGGGEEGEGGENKPKPAAGAAADKDDDDDFTT